MGKEYFLEKARQNEPEIYEREICTPHFGEPIPDASKWFQYHFEEREAPRGLGSGDSCYMDFGNHYVGYFSFKMDRGAHYPDAPVRVRIKLAENLYELESDYDNYVGGLQPTWLQQEIICIDEPSVIRLPRRYAFRYVKFTVETTLHPQPFGEFKITAVTSADISACKPVACAPDLAAIDRVGVHTLENCMQRFFEDGPKRDRRLWLGDLRIQALTGYYTFHNVELVKKCMYLFAAYTEPGEKTPRAIYENSYESLCDKSVLDDYALMFAVSLCDYYEHTQDAALVDELFDIANSQLHIICEGTEDGIIKERDGFWAFIDWCDGLKKVTSMQGVLLYALDKMIWLCEQTGRSRKAVEYTEKAEVFRQAAREKLYDEEKGLFVNRQDDFQLSLHSQVWMILGGVVKGEEAKELLQRILLNTGKKDAVTPYMHHYTVEALIHAGMMREALQYIKEYWGKMVELGADTYWEVFVPGNLSVSPYGNPVMNSCCHAWSCSAAYFIRRYFTRRNV